MTRRPKSCPFCRALPDDGLVLIAAVGDDFAVKCIDCGARGPLWRSKHAAIVAWNNPQALAEDRRKIVFDFGQKLRDAYPLDLAKMPKPGQSK